MGTCVCGHARTLHATPFGPCRGGEGPECFGGSCVCGEYEEPTAAEPISIRRALAERAG